MTNPNAIQSPCVRNCCLNPENICLGCFRSMEEICRWTQADNSTKLAILSNAAERRRLQSSQRNPVDFNSGVD